MIKVEKAWSVDVGSEFYFLCQTDVICSLKYGRECFSAIEVKVYFLT